MKKKKLKGFTLVELIVVMAIFGILLGGVMVLVDPVSKIMSKTNIKEANNSATDNLKRYFEGTLKYANAIEVCDGDLSQYDGTSWVAISGATEQERMEKAVINFLNAYYINRADDHDAPYGKNDSRKVRVLKIDNDNGGKVSEYEWEFIAGYTYKTQSDSINHPDTFDVDNFVSASLKPGTYKESIDVINPVYYDNYSFYIAPGYNTLQTVSLAASDDNSYCAEITPMTYVDPSDGSTKTYGDTFSPSMFSMSIITYKNGKPYPAASDDPNTTEDDTRVFESPFAISNATMSLVNINSSFSKLSNTSYWGPVRYEGVASGGKSYNRNSKCDLDDDGEWDYTPQSPTQNLCYPHPKISGNNIYFIYTLPNAE